MKKRILTNQELKKRQDLENEQLKLLEIRFNIKKNDMRAKARLKKIERELRKYN